MFKFFSSRPISLEKWANLHSNKASADDLIAGAIVSSFAEHHKHWKFVGGFNQKHYYANEFQSTSLSRKMVGKKHVEIVFLFEKTGEGSFNFFKVCGCEVNGIEVSNTAFKRIYNGWTTLREKVKKAEEVAEKAKAEMEKLETKWNLAEDLLGFKVDKLGRLNTPVEEAKA